MSETQIRDYLVAWFNANAAGRAKPSAHPHVDDLSIVLVAFDLNALARDLNIRLGENT
jgi:hypothetical protein